MKKLSFVLLLLACNAVCFSQNMKLVGIGSSTTAGQGSFPLDSSWIRRFNYYYKYQLGIADTTYNLGVGGYNCYKGMPSSYVPPPLRPGADINQNVTMAVSLLTGMAIPANGVIIVNYPTNGYDTYSIAEVMNCLQIIYDSATRLGNRCYITTTQPRSDGAFASSAVKRKLADIKDSILNRFGVDKTINFYDGMYNPVDTTILGMYSAGDNIHFNNTGHRVLFQRVLAKNVFGLALPVKLQQFRATLRDKKVALRWSAEHDDPNGSFTVQRSQNGQAFESLQQVPVKKNTGLCEYDFADQAPLPGSSYYRLSVQERDHVYYSKIVSVKNEQPALVLKKLYPIPAEKWLHLEVMADKAQKVTIDVINSNGIAIQKYARAMVAGNNRFNLPVQQLPGGLYFIRMNTNDGHAIVQPFTK
jgi:hypothetical protein